MRTYSYTCIHIPSGKMFTCTRRFGSLRDFYDNVTKWNTSNPTVWLYAPTGDA